MLTETITGRYLWVGTQNTRTLHIYCLFIIIIIFIHSSADHAYTDMGYLQLLVMIQSVGLMENLLVIRPFTPSHYSHYSELNLEVIHI